MGYIAYDLEKKSSDDFKTKYTANGFTEAESKFLLLSSLSLCLQYDRYFEIFPYQGVWNRYIAQSLSMSDLQYLTAVHDDDWGLLLRYPGRYGFVDEHIKKFKKFKKFKIPISAVETLLSDGYALSKFLELDVLPLSEKEIESLIRKTPADFEFVDIAKDFIEFSDRKSMKVSEEIIHYILDKALMKERDFTYFLNRVKTVPAPFVEKVFQRDYDSFYFQLCHIESLFEHGFINRYEGKENLPLLGYDNGGYYIYCLFHQYEYPISYYTRLYVWIKKAWKRAKYVHYHQ